MVLVKCKLHSSGSGQGPVQDLVTGPKVPYTAQNFSTVEF
jgi:hypothetical protein